MKSIYQYNFRKLWPFYEKKKRQAKKSFESEINEEKKPEKKKKKKVKEIEASETEAPKSKKRSRAASTDNEALPKKKIKKTTKKSIEKVEEKEEITEEIPSTINNSQAEKVPFGKGDYSRFNNLHESLKDYSFEAKFRYGNGDEYGRIGHQRLAPTRGKDFKKEKTKLKNKGFIGGCNLIDPHKINAIKL